MKNENPEQSKRVQNEASFARRIQPVARRLRMVSDHVYAEFGLSQATGRVLLQVARMGGEVQQTELVHALDLNGPGVVRLIDNLESQSLVVRRVDPQDRRSNFIVLTPAGRRLTEKAEKALNQVRPGLFDNVDDADLETALRVLDLLDDKLMTFLEGGA
jgi:MarR family transcriptional regulator for hemolysin